ncbi:MAG: plasmid pRiA4b ORF-3 family protein [Mariniphaga sp.]|nr:plasmid pRiA4b ORF-3 family protein [Mariniphaga sp.]
MAYQFKIQLMNVSKPPVWRQIQVPESITFHDLHNLIQLVFGWEDCHFYQFSPKGYGSHPTIAIPSKEDWEETDMKSKKTKLNKVFTIQNQTFNYLYDFGDDWSHKITFEKLVPEDIKLPVCLNGKGACPPEDCGGPWGFENMKIILADPTHDEYQDMKDWLGLDEDEFWDANSFDIAEVNELLKGFK